MKIAICDDEKIIRDKICKLLNAIDRECEITQFQSGDEIINAPDKFDIYILDIEMPGSSGIEVAEKLLETYTNLHIIFLTSHAEHMQLGYRFKAHRFLTKPIDNYEFNEAINSAEKEISSVKFLLLSKNSEKTIIRHEDIVYIESLGDQTAIYTTDDMWISNDPLRYYLDELSPTRFFKVHKQYIVSLGRILDTENSLVKLHNMEVQIPISRRNSKLLSEAILRYIKEDGRMY